MSYLVATKTAVVEALRAVFDTTYPNNDFQGDNIPLVSIEYPVEQSHYPGIWVQYADNGELTRAGIDNEEVEVSIADDTVARATRWRFTGSITLTMVALTSWERDRLYDEVVRTFVGTRYNTELAPFRIKIEENDLVAINANFDDLQPFGDTASRGTPWDTDEILYEKSISFDVIGEFLSDSRTSALVPLSKVTFMKYLDGSEVPDWPGDPGSTTVAPTPDNWDYTSWT